MWRRILLSNLEINVMLTIDWQASETYEYVNNIPAAGLAWEFLRRNEDYNRDYAELMSQKRAAKDQLDHFSTHWGLRFPV